MTPVLLEGAIGDNASCQNLVEFSHVAHLYTVWPDTSVTYYQTYKYWFHYVLNTQINLVTRAELPDPAAYDAISESMPAFPRQGYVQEQDGVVIVKLSN